MNLGYRVARTLALLCFLLLALSGCKDDASSNNDADTGVNNEEVDSGPLAPTCEPLENRRCECEFGSGEQTCAEGGGDWNECLCPIQELEAREDAVEIKPALPGSASVEGQTLILPARGNGEYKDLEPGTIIYLLEGDGLAGRVTAAAANDQQIVISTEQVEIHEVFARLKVSMDEVPLDVDAYSPDVVKAALQNEASSHDANLSRGITFDGGYWSIRPSGSVAFDIQFEAGSRANFSPTLSTELDIAWPLLEEPELEYFHFIAGLDSSFTLKPRIEVSGLGQVSFESELIQLAQKLAQHPNPEPAEVPLGAGFSAEVTLNLRCQLGIEGDAVLSTAFGLGIDASGGVRYDGDWGVVGGATVTTPVGEVNQADWQGDVFLRCELKPRVRLRFLKFAYGYLEAGPYVKATQHFATKRQFEVIGGFNGVVAVGAELDFEAVVITLFEKVYPLFDVFWQLYQRQFAVCGDGYRQKDSYSTFGNAEVVEYREECDSGGFNDFFADKCDANCECIEGWVPSTAPDYILEPWFEGNSYRVEDARFWEHGYPYNLCQTLCGNGVVDAGEVCDNGMSQNTCGPDGCSADCKRRTGICGDGIVDAFCGELCDDSEDPNGADDACDTCVGCFLSQVCGDRRVDAACGETCDHGGTPDALCNVSCESLAGSCGDGIVNVGPDGIMEECDDGNRDSCDGCDWSCKLITNGCGDGVICGAEQCEPSVSGQDDFACNADCTARVCGDGYLNAAAFEECDERSATCNVDCTFSTCGDYKLNPLAGEECDQGGVDTVSCHNDCKLTRCGDGRVNPVSEACDDGDADSCTPGCNALCTGPVAPTVCGDGFVDSACGAEVCDDGALNGTCGHCSGDCQTPPANVCGDSVIDPTCEVCDDGNTDGGDGCSADCGKVETCGDAYIDEGEVCDDGDTSSCGGECLSDCSGLRGDVCGDGNLATCEQCEDSDPTNASVDSGCSVSTPNCNGCTVCSADVCGDGIQGPSEACDPGGMCSEGTEYCTVYDISNCGTGQYCFFNEFECAGSCTRVVTCGDGFVDGVEECDGGAGCLSNCTFGP